MAMLTYKMGMSLNYVLYIVCLEELIVIQLLEKCTNFVNLFLTSSLELTIGSCADLDGSISQTPSSTANFLEFCLIQGQRITTFFFFTGNIN